MPDHGSPTVRRRRLAAELHRLREQVGLTGDQVAERLGWSPSKISRIENNRSGIKLPDLRRLLDLYGVEDQHRAELVTLAREAGQRGWWEIYSDTLPDEHVPFIGLEAEAKWARSWEPQTVPGLLQTEDYARKMIETWRWVEPIPPAAIERRVKARLERQQVLTREQPLILSATLDESVLLRRFGDSSVMREQLAHLIEIAELPNVTLRILPLDGPHPAGTDSFVHLQFAPELGVALHDVVYIENLRGALYLEDEIETYQYRLAFDRLTQESLDPRKSIMLIQRAIRRFWH